MSKFVISPHFRLQEWVAEEKGYFKAEGLDYEFRDNYGPGDVGKKHATPDKIGAYQSIEQGRACDVSGACHWTVNVAASTGHGKLYADAYSVAPCGVFVPAESDIRHPSDLKGVPISVGYQSGSHYSTIQGLEQYMALEDIKLSFADGSTATKTFAYFLNKEGKPEVPIVRGTAQPQTEGGATGRALSAHSHRLSSD